MLTSDCLQSQKEDTILAWEERGEQCMVSTIVDGIDNNCRNHAMSDAAIQARAKQDQIESNKEYVHQQLIIMKEKCVVCKRSTCGGNIATCLNRESRHYCYSCHAYSCGDNCHGIAKQDRELVMVNHVCSASWH